MEYVESKADVRRVEWLVEGWQDGAYKIVYAVDGVRLCEFRGTFDDVRGVFWLKPRVIYPEGRRFPEVKCLPATATRKCF